jgi:hypothetical protein
MKAKKSGLWTPKNLGKVLATRQFKLKKGKTRKSAFLQIGCPVQKPNGGKNDPWICPLMIKGFGKDEFHYSMGIDGVQALNGTFFLSLSILDTYSKSYCYEIEFLDPRMPLIFEWWDLKDVKTAQKKHRRLFEKENKKLDKIFAKKAARRNLDKL